MASLLELLWSLSIAFVVLLFIQYIVPVLVKTFLRKRATATKLFEEKWKRDTVYLYQMPGTSTLPSVSPFCLKVETFLRLHHINYERRYLIVGRGNNGKLPFVELNGEHITDSEIILRRIVFHFKIKEYESAEDAVHGHAVARMADAHTYNLFLHYKVIHNPGNLFKGMLGGLVPDFAMDMIAPLVAPFVSAFIHRRLNGTFGSFSDEEYRELTRKELTVYQDMLGEKKFLFGDKINSADCSVFSQLAAVLYLDQHCHPVYLLKSHQFVPLRNYIERVRDSLFAGKFAM